MFSIPQHCVVIAVLLNTVSGYTTFTPNCPSLEHPVNFVNNANFRSTLGILWPCLFTLIACTWTILHLNVPEQRAGRDPGWRGDLKWTFKGIWTKTKWMLITMLAPELILSLTMMNLVHAKEERRRLGEFVRQDGVPWSLTHSMFVNMGGFAIKVLTGDSIQSSMLPSPPQLEDTHPRLSHDRELRNSTSDQHQLSLDSTIEQPTAVPSQPLTAEHDADAQYLAHGCYHVTAVQLRMLRREGYLKKLPFITTEELNARSKSDSFSKIIAVVQISWMGFQVLLRAGRGLATSQLEIAVTAFSVCGILIYAFSWSKPKDVQVPLMIMEHPLVVPADLLKRLNRCQDAEGETCRATFVRLPEWLEMPPLHDGSRIQNITVWESDSGASMLALGYTFGGGILGAIHICAWNFHYSTEIERQLWRAASVACTVLPALLICLSVLVFFEPAIQFVCWLLAKNQTRNVVEAKLDSMMGFFNWIFYPLYFLARLYLLVETFRTLFFLPVDAYTSTWASNIPHLS